MATLTYVYADSTAVLGPLATYAEPHCYDLCAEHSERLTAPRGWEVVRLAVDTRATVPVGDDLEALADAVREAARTPPRGRPGAPRGDDPRGGVPGQGQPAPAGGSDPIEVARRAHLRILRSPEP